MHGVRRHGKSFVLLRPMMAMPLGTVSSLEAYIERSSPLLDSASLPSVTLEKRRSVNSLSAKIYLSSALYRALSKAYAEC